MGLEQGRRHPPRDRLRRRAHGPVDVSPEQKKFIEDHGSDLLSEKFYSSLVERCAQELLPLIK